MSKDESTTAAPLVAADPKPTTAMTVYEPKDMPAAWEMAGRFAKSQLLSAHTAEQVLLIMATGAELGIPATTALRGIHVIKGRISISADLKVSLCIARKDLCEYFSCIESTDDHATYETKRKGRQAARVTFSIADARRAGLGVDTADSNWSKYPRVMLRHRASSELATQEYPEVVMGLVTTDEAADIGPPSTIEREEAPPKPLVLDAEIAEPASAAPSAPPASVPPPPAGGAAAPPTQERPAAAAKPAAKAKVGLGDLVAEWKQRLLEAKTNEQCQAVRAEIKADGRCGKVTLEALVEAYNEATKRIKDENFQPPPPASNEKPAAPVVEREPGSDDE